MNEAVTGIILFAAASVLCGGYLWWYFRRDRLRMQGRDAESLADLSRPNLADCPWCTSENATPRECGCRQPCGVTWCHARTLSGGKGGTS